MPGMLHWVSPDDMPSGKVKALSHPVWFFVLDSNALEPFVLSVLARTSAFQAAVISDMDECHVRKCLHCLRHFGAEFCSKVLERNFAHKPHWEPSTIAAPKLRRCFQWQRPSSTPIAPMISETHSQG